MATLRPDAVAQALFGLCVLYLRAPNSIATDATTGAPVFEFIPPLTTAEQASFADLQLMAKFAIGDDLTLAEFQAMKPDLATGKQYLGLASPTNAQTVAVIKAIIRVLGDLLRS